MMMKLTAIVCVTLLACSSPVFGASERKQKTSAAAEHESRALQEGDDFDFVGGDLVFQRSYLAITPPSNFKTLVNTQANAGFNIIIGVSQTQSGGVYDPADIQIVNRPNGATTSEELEFGVQTGQQFAGRAQPKFVPKRDPGFFFDGRCTSSSGNGISGITAHTCTLNLCLGGGGFNCLALYCGSAFVFDPLKQPTNTFKNSPQLPPSYPCTIIGGTNVFQGAKGSVDITTLTGRTTPLKTNSDGDSSLFILQNGPTEGSKTGVQFGFITQRLNVISNKPLPPAP
jgi:hypothetical protein